MKPEKFIVQSQSGQVQKVDLMRYPEAMTPVLELLTGQMRPLQEGFHWKSRALPALIRETRREPSATRYPAESFQECPAAPRREIVGWLARATFWHITTTLDRRPSIYMPSTMAGSAKTIALIEDDSGIRASLKGLLTAFGYQVDSFASAEEFLSVAAGGGWSGLVIDVNLGTTSGLDLVRHPAVKAMNVAIILTSGTSDEATWKQALAIQCAGYLRKPFRANELRETLKRAGI
jgi:CheY-like chemotaxis protein